MTSELSRVARSVQLALPTRDIIDLIASYMNHVEREFMTAYIGIEITQDHRTQLKSRLAHIDGVCTDVHQKFERSRIDNAVSYMIGMFTVGRSISKVEAEATAKGYGMALAGVPAFFIERACMDFVKGKVPNHDNSYTPTSAQVRVRAEELMVPFREEAANIRTLLTAKQRIRPSAEEHERLLAKTRAVIDGTDPDMKAMRDRMEADRMVHLERQTRQIGESTAKQRRRYCQQHGVDPDGVASPSLVRNLTGVLPKKKAAAKQESQI